MWAETIEPSISQGDLTTPLVVGSPYLPETLIKRNAVTRSGALQTWDEVEVWSPDDKGVATFVGQGRKSHCIVISHSCDIDNGGGTTPLQIAPVFPISGKSTDHINAIREGKTYLNVWLPELPGVIDESYVDLRLMTFTKKKVLEKQGARLASLSPEGSRILQLRIVAALTRLNLESYLP